ncbi:cyclin-P3-1-like [Andrographis paniculata]|uniref:cyclin-P3-1-like n=1 Tax=Andrographis paniculata TaxID=175694 RepID=UPI0021E932BB|nr:cyclin-P3-1-like [Andrographis paniculata]XP_051141762.1 cyclin-P3-1-like [Andrographis paniculata]
MSSLALKSAVADENGSSSSDDYVALGLYEARGERRREPRVLSLLSALLERSVRKNERMVETSRYKDRATLFHGVSAPSLTIHQYVVRIFKYSRCSPSCFVLAQVYIDRFIRCTALILTSLTVHRLLIAAVVVAAKFIDDSFFNNAYYARVGGVSTAELNKLEMKLLFGLDFRLHVTVDTFDDYCSTLRRDGVAVTGGFGDRRIGTELH